MSKAAAEADCRESVLQIEGVAGRGPALLRRPLLLAGAVLVLAESFWLGPPVISAVAEGAGIPWDLLVPAFFGWQVWLLLTPAIFQLTHRFPLEGEKWAHSLLFHGSAAVLGSSLSALVSALLSVGTPGAAGSASASLATRLVEQFQSGTVSAGLLVYVAIAAIGWSSGFYRRYRDRELEASRLENRLSRARLEALRNRLQPHFLFNTLHTISALMHVDLERADALFAALSDLLRLSLDDSSQEVPLHREIELLRRYLEIESTRFSDRLAVTVDVEPETWDLLVPHLLLLPMVEDAIRNGVALRSAPGVLGVRARTVGERLEIEIRDDGPDGVSSARSSAAFAATTERLEELYGGRQRVWIDQDVGGGSRLRISLPQRRAEGARSSMTSSRPAGPSGSISEVGEKGAFRARERRQA